MNGTSRFFLDELTRLQNNCGHIRHGMNGDDLNDPVHAGELEQLEIELAHYREVVELLAHTATPEEALAAIRQCYMRAQLAHERCLQTRHRADCDNWWRTLGQMQYMSCLFARFQAWMHAHAAQDAAETEDDEPLPLAELKRACEKLTTFAAQAKAHLSVARHEMLVRHDPRTMPLDD